uniref:Uncharacterized protein n=1 Tax=Cairina moschata TaxID=8855 RepID=A0A8C3CF94_CAIMO
MAAAPVRDREALQRLSFLFQAAHWVLPHSPALARFYCSTQRTAARRLVLRMAPAVKRAVCRRCCSLLLGCQRLRGGGQPRIVLRCRACGLHRRLLCPPKPHPAARPRPQVRKGAGLVGFMNEWGWSQQGRGWGFLVE